MITFDQMRSYEWVTCCFREIPCGTAVTSVMSVRVGPTTCNISNFQNPTVQREPVMRTQDEKTPVIPDCPVKTHNSYRLQLEEFLNCQKSVKTFQFLIATLNQNSAGFDGLCIVLPPNTLNFLKCCLVKL